jgi:hypothetical protein
MALMSGNLPEEPSLHEAFIKEIFLRKGIKPQDVDELDIELINNLMEITVQRKNVEEIKKVQQDSLRRLQNGTNNQGETSIRHRSFRRN